MFPGLILNVIALMERDSANVIRTLLTTINERNRASGYFVVVTQKPAPVFWRILESSNIPISYTGLCPVTYYTRGNFLSVLAQPLSLQESRCFDLQTNLWIQYGKSCPVFFHQHPVTNFIGSIFVTALYRGTTVFHNPGLYGPLYCKGREKHNLCRSVKYWTGVDHIYKKHTGNSFNFQHVLHPNHVL